MKNTHLSRWQIQMKSVRIESDSTFRNALPYDDDLQEVFERHKSLKIRFRKNLAKTAVYERSE